MKHLPPLLLCLGLAFGGLTSGCTTEEPPVPVPDLVRNPTDGSLSIDADPFREASTRLGLPAPPGVSDLEPAAFEKLHAATKTVSASRDAESYARVGALYYAYALRESAIACYEQAHQRAPDDARWAHLLARLLKDEGALDRALAMVQTARRLDGSYAASAGLAGDIHLALGQHRDAFREYEAYEKLRPAEAFGPYGQAQAMFRLGQYDQAAVLLKRARERAPHSMPIAYLEGRLLARMGQSEAAAQRVAPMARATANTGLTFRDPLFLAVHEETDSSFRLRIEYQAASGGGNLEAAARAAESLLQRRPDDVGTMYNLAGIYRQLKKYDQATAWLEKALTIQPRFARLHCGLAEVYLARNELGKAATSLHGALGIDPGYGRALGLRGLIFIRQKQWVPAEASLIAAIRAEPDRPEYPFYLGTVYEQTGDRGRAIRWYRKTLELRPRDPRALARLKALGE